MSQGDAHPEQAALSRRVRELELMVEITRRLTSTLDQERLLTLISRMAVELVGCEDASVILEDERTGELVFLTSAGPTSEALKKIRFPVEGSIAGAVFRNRQPLIVTDTGTDPRHNPEVDSAIDFETHSILAVPMIFQDRPIGVLEAVNKRNAADFGEHDVHILATLAAQAAVAIENSRLVQDLKEANRQLSQLDQLKSEFIAIASHELRTPLTLILGYASFLREEASGKEGEQLDVVLQAATQLRGLIDDMVNLSNIDSGSTELNPRDFILQDVVLQSIEAQQQFAAAKKLKIDTTLPETPLWVHADREKIAIILTNLLDNAIKFTPPGGRIDIAVRHHGGGLAISVSDTGIGVPESDAERIFERFYQVESHLTRRHEGMGLGLSIAKAMVELHGGRIWVESVEGRGSRFTFTLPFSGFGARSQRS
jgi:signal transduction histidine kinase